VSFNKILTTDKLVVITRPVLTQTTSKTRKKCVFPTGNRVFSRLIVFRNRQRTECRGVRTYTPSTKNIAGRFDKHTCDTVNNDGGKGCGRCVVASTKMLSMMTNIDCVKNCVHGVVVFIDYTKNCGDAVVFVDETKDVGFEVVKK